VISRLGALFADNSLLHFRGKGCSRCNHTGYLGRLGVYEVLWPDDKLRDLIARGANMLEMAAVARDSGTRPLIEDARDKVHSGMTTAEEVLRVLGAQK
jgi:type II secretory ATPase GspE/PulE/Tfp pilus assembly ATPase PilB-like protein